MNGPQLNRQRDIVLQVRSLHLDKPDGWGIYTLRTINRQIGEGADAIVEKEEGYASSLLAHLPV